MTLVHVGQMNIPNYTAVSGDIVANAIPGATTAGSTIFLTDTGAWKIIKGDLTLADYAIPAAFGGTISLGAVTTGTSYAIADGQGNFALLTNSAAGGDVASSGVLDIPMVFNGVTWDKPRTPKIFKDLSAVSINSIATVWTPAGGKKFRLMGGSISSTTAISVLFEDNAAGTTIIRTPKLLVDTPYTFDLGNGILSATADKVLKATGSGNGAITGFLYGTEE